MSDSQPATKKFDRSMAIKIGVGIVVVILVALGIAWLVNRNKKGKNVVPSSVFKWSDIPAQDTKNLIKVGDRIALFHTRTGMYISADQSQMLTASASNPSNDSWAQFQVLEGDAEFPGSVRLQNVALASSLPQGQGGIISIRIYPDSQGYVEMDAKGQKGPYTPLYFYPPDDTAALAAADAAKAESRTVLTPSATSVPLTISNPRALLQGNSTYPYLAFAPDGAVVTRKVKEQTTRQSQDSQLILVYLKQDSTTS